MFTLRLTLGAARYQKEGRAFLAERRRGYRKPELLKYWLELEAVLREPVNVIGGLHSAPPQPTNA